MASNYELTDRDRAMLAFESQHVAHSAAKDELIRDAFHVSAPRYYQLLNRLVRRPEALQADPVLVNRIIRTSDERAQQRASRVLTPRVKR